MSVQYEELAKHKSRFIFINWKMLKSLKHTYNSKLYQCFLLLFSFIKDTYYEDYEELK